MHKQLLLVFIFSSFLSCKIPTKNDKSVLEQKLAHESAGDTLILSDTKIYQWKGKIIKSEMTSFQYGTHLFKGNLFHKDSPVLNPIIFAVQSQKLNLDNFLDKVVIISGSVVAGYPLNKDEPYLINVMDVFADQKTASEITK